MIDKTDLTKLYDISSEIAEIYRNHIHNSGVTASGQLESFTWEVDFDGNSYKLIFNLPPQWYFVEYGRQPDLKYETKWTDPIGDIMAWMDVKHIDKAPKPSYKNSIKISRAKVPTKEQSAYLIVRKIRHEGYYGRYKKCEGKYLLKNTLDESEQLIVELTNAIAGAIVNTTVLPDIMNIDK